MPTDIEFNNCTSLEEICGETLENVEDEKGLKEFYERNKANLDEYGITEGDLKAYFENGSSNPTIQYRA